MKWKIIELGKIVNNPCDHSLFPYFKHEVGQTENLLRRLKPGKIIRKRSLAFIGSVWKWIAYNADHEDLLTLQNNINNLLQNNNRQTVISQLYVGRCNNSTKITNIALKEFKSGKENKEGLISNTHIELKILKEELENVNQAIHWAKGGIIRSLILYDRNYNFR